MNWIYPGDHPGSPHEYAYECPVCGLEFDDETGCPDCADEPEPPEPYWEDIQ